MGLVVKTPHPVFTEELLYKYLNFMESYFLASKEYCFIIASLLWENRQYIQEDIRREKENPQLTVDFTSILTNVLIKLGIPISAKTLQENKNNGYELLGSFVLELQRTHDLLTKHTVRFIEDQTLELNDFQKEIWEGLDSTYNAFAFSSGTSTGKSFLLTHKIISWAYEQIITNNQIFRAVIIVPSIALINQNLIDLSNLLKNIPQLNQRIKLYQHFIELEDNQNAIFIVTQERMREIICDLSQQSIKIQNIFLSLNLLICDEIQNIGISTADDISDNTNNQYNQRADLYHSIFELITDNDSINIQKIILAGANISRDDLQQKYKKMLNEKSYTYFPKDNKQYISPVTNIQLSLLENKDDKKYYIKQDILLKTEEKLSIQIEVQKTNLFKPKWDYDKLHGSTLIEHTYDVLNNLNQNYPNMVVIAYQRTPKMINTSAKRLMEKQPKDLEISEPLKSLQRSLSKYLPDDCKVVQVSEYGIALHHGQLLKEVRILLELAIKENLIKLVVCNSTITQGVNLPVKFIIIPNKGTLSHKNELLNLKGRAGRLMQDLVGYVLFLDVTTFQISSSNSTSMLDDTIPEDMDTADEYYQKIIDQHSDSINEVLKTLKRIGQNKDINLDVARAVVKIRQQLLKDNKIKDNDLYQGIDKSILTKNLEQLWRYQEQLATLSSLTLKHMVIDPMDIYYLYNRLPEDLDFFNDSDKHVLIYAYYKKILDLYNKELTYCVQQIMKIKELKPIYGFCEKWINNKTYLLKEILTEQQKYDQNNSKKFDEIQILKAYTSYISYDFVKLVAVIEDLYQYKHKVKTDWTSVLRYGTNNQKIIDLMHMGLEREMSILIVRNTKDIDHVDKSIAHYYHHHADEWEKKLLEKFNYL